MKKKSYWYFMTYIECPQCGNSHVEKKRVYGKKPKNPKERQTYFQRWDYCGVGNSNI
jgi:hypothetical protein